MLVQNAINTLLNSTEFNDLLESADIDQDGCHELTAEIKKTAAYWYYEIYCNYNDPSTKDNDIIGKVQVMDDGTGKVLNVQFL